jgi:phosphopantothenoylcysteine decarboxylase/phosphopantothenate--cysteine ligase
MKSSVVIKGCKSGMTVILNPDTPFEQLLEDVGKKFKESEKFWGSAQMTLTLEGRELTPIEELQVTDAITANSQIEILCLLDTDANRIARCEKALTEQDLAGRHVLVTAGPTQEAMDPVRFLSNHSTGKMGYAIAARAAMRGADATLVSGPTALDTPHGVTRVDIVSARDMYDAVTSRAPEQDFIIKAAAVGDYRPAQTADEKLKKGDGEMNIELTRNPDILAALGKDKKPGQLLCGFAMETQNLLDNAESKLRRKNCDMLVANSLRDKGAGFGTDTNVATLLFKDGHRETPPMMSKEALADLILDRLLAMSN